MSKEVIQINNLSKRYRLGEIGTGTISHDLNRWIAKVMGKADPFEKVGQINDRTKKAESDFVWALKDINLNIEEGKVVGIIGRNGAGKSTLLKVLSRITAPTKGSINIKGRMGSLLEVGTGMHPELTGRENIFLNGAIMGMTKAEISRKFDEIVDFAGCEMYVDTPVRRYSSGMGVRLGFAVAAFLEPEILVVDEVLAVGDAEFQNKAIGKMKNVSQQDGRTILFVSHNMGVVRSLCQEGIIIENGGLKFNGTIDDAVDTYLTESFSNENNINLQSEFIDLSNFGVSGKDGSVVSGEDMIIKFDYKKKVDYPFKNLRIVFDVVNGRGMHMFRLVNQNFDETFDMTKQEGEVICKIPSVLLNAGSYYLSIRLLSGKTFLLNKEHCINFKVDLGNFFETGKIDPYSGNMLVKSEWKYDQ